MARIIHTVKHVVRWVPKPVRAIVKKNKWLVDLYRQRLADAGYISLSSLESPLLYRHNLTYQQHELAAVLAPLNKPDTELALVVIVPEFDAKLLAFTCESISELSSNFSKIFVICDAVDKDDVQNMLNRYESAVKAAHVVTGYAPLSDVSGAGYFVFQGDQLNPETPSVLGHLIDDNVSVAYVDTDRRSKKGLQVLPEFYPDWNPDLQLTTAYVRSGVWIKDVSGLGALDEEPLYESQIAFWLIKQWLNGEVKNVQHLPYSLLTRKMQLDYPFNNAPLSVMKTIRQFATPSFSLHNRVLSLLWDVEKAPLVSLIIPTKNAKDLVKDCIESILERTNYQNYEIILVDNNSDEAESLEYFDEIADHPKITVLKYPHPFNYSAINNFAAKHANGEVIGLINNDIEVIAPQWLDHMVGHVMREDIGCVGARLLFDDMSVQHAGVVMGYGGGAGHAHKHFPVEHPGYLNRLAATHNFSAVTAACLLVTKEDFFAVDGLNEEDLTVAFNDVDFCLRILGLGRRNLYCAEATLYHHESVSRGTDESPEKAARFKKEVDYLQSTWSHFIEHDPAYNPNLTLTYENFAINEKRTR